MNEYADSLTDGLSQLEQDIGAVIRWDGVDFPCVGGAAMRGKRLDLGGYQFNADATIILRTALFEEERPGEQQEITYTPAPGAAPADLRIESIRNLWDQILVLECNHQNAAA